MIHVENRFFDRLFFHAVLLPQVLPLLYFLNLLSIIRRLKQGTSYRMCQLPENHLKIYYWKERNLWSYGYFCSTIENISKDIVIEYIRNKG